MVPAGASSVHTTRYKQRVDTTGLDDVCITTSDTNLLWFRPELLSPGSAAELSDVHRDLDLACRSGQSC